MTLEATRPVLLLDYLRVPYRLRSGADDESVVVSGARGSLTWLQGSNAHVPGAYRLGETPIFGRVLPDGGKRDGAEQLARISREDSEHVASVWRDPDGSVFLPFDPDELIHNLWSERYRELAQTRTRSTFEAVVKPLYYRVRAVLPSRLRLRLRRLYSGVATPAFPRWPVETALHDLYAFLLRTLEDVSAEPLPMLSLWPRGRSWAFVVTHDVERAGGYAAVERLRAVERAAGYVSSWNFVPQRDYRVEPALLDRLREEGCEIGVHGLRHDGRDLDPGRVREIRRFAEEWGAVGFRSPSLLRDFELMPSLGFEYDSSYPDTDPLQAQAGGCCSWLPFLNGDLVELPITLAQDHNVFELLGHADETLWREKAAFLRSRGGMALLLTHPDYMLQAERLAAYGRLLAEVAGDETVWKALPREVSGWWRRRASSALVGRNGRWEIEGPAAGEATVGLCRDLFAELGDA